MAANPLSMKHWNMNQIRRILLGKDKMTIPELSKISGLSAVTLHSLMGQLIETGEIVEDETLPSRGGRPAVAYRYRKDYRYSLCISMMTRNGEDTLYVEVSNLFKETVSGRELLVKDCTLKGLRDLIENTIKEYPAIRVIGFAIPGISYEGKIRNIDYPLFHNDEFFQNLKDDLQLPVILENDINAAVLGYTRSHHKDDSCIAGLYLPRNYPPGSALLVNGMIHRGAHGMAGEVKFLPYEIPWNQLPFTKEEHTSILEKMILTITCLYDPSLLLIYTEEISRDIEEIQTSLQAEQEIILLPDLVLSSQIQEDIGRGIKELAWENLLEQIMK